jgi:cell filamentation protein
MGGFSRIGYRINDRELFMKGIDVSYYYEGYSEFKTEEL